MKVTESKLSILAVAVTAHCHGVSLTVRGLLVIYPGRVSHRKTKASRAGRFGTERLCHYPCIPSRQMA